MVAMAYLLAMRRGPIPPPACAHERPAAPEAPVGAKLRSAETERSSATRSAARRRAGTPVEEPAFAGLPPRRRRPHRRTSFGGEWLCPQRQGALAHAVVRSARRRRAERVPRRRISRLG